MDDRLVGGRPVRVVVAVPVVVEGLPGPRFGAIDVQWFRDVGAARANEAWLAAVEPELCLGSRLLGGGSCRVVAEEVVVRGQQYLDRRREADGERYKMMSFGKRNPRLTPEAFSQRWRAEAGRLGGEDIPDEVKGLAYVQNHPVPLAEPDGPDGPEWPFDAVNEVWFERLDHLRQRGAWFAARQDAALRNPTASTSTTGGFMSPTQVWSMFVREVPLSGVSASTGPTSRTPSGPAPRSAAPEAPG